MTDNSVPASGESVLLTKKNILICNDLTTIPDQYKEEFEYLCQNFCGTVYTSGYPSESNFLNFDGNIYLCGDISKYNGIIEFGDNENYNKKVYIISELSKNTFSGAVCTTDDDGDFYSNQTFIGIGAVPVNINGVGVYFRQFFDSLNYEKIDYFESINNEHQFQSLTESNKPSTAFRTGLYLSPVKHQTKLKKDKSFDCTETRFGLMRCSSNFSGPTENFHPTDNKVVSSVNGVAKNFFGPKPARLNHVLAQIYENKKIATTGAENAVVEKKAKIKDHSDKTEDMPRNGLIAFCTFYKTFKDGKFNSPELQGVKKNGYDYTVGGVSVLTKLRFRLKPTLANSTLTQLQQFDVVLYPNSVFVMSLLSNRLYTHEIVPSVLSVDKIPIRMGYVIRCSKTEAVFKNGQMFIDEGGKMTALVPPTKEDVHHLKELYLQENITDSVMNYEPFYYSLNNGDYTMPNL